MDLNPIILVLYNCPNIFERLVGYSCYLSDREELYVHASIVAILFLVFAVILFSLRQHRKSKIRYRSD
jgi:uncharacterized membrane protein